MRTCDTLLACSLLVVLCCCLCDTSWAAPKVGWWWNPALSGSIKCTGPGGGVIADFSPPPLPSVPLSLPGTFGAVIGISQSGLISKEIPPYIGPFPAGGSYTLTGRYTFVGGDECDTDTEFCPPPEP